MYVSYEWRKTSPGFLMFSKSVWLSNQPPVVLLTIFWEECPFWIVSPFSSSPHYFPFFFLFTQVKRKLDLDSDHQYVSTTRPSSGQAPPSTPAPPRGIYRYTRTHVHTSLLFTSVLVYSFTRDWSSRQTGLVVITRTVTGLKQWFSTGLVGTQNWIAVSKRKRKRGASLFYNSTYRWIFFIWLF